MLLVLFYACFLAPLPLLALAWSKSNRLPIEFSILTLSAVLFVSSTIRSLKGILLGMDYSHRLFATIEFNIVLAIALAVYLGIRSRWVAAAAALILCLAWLLAGAVNTVV